MFVFVFSASLGYAQALYNRVGDIVQGKIVNYKVKAVSDAMIIVENERNQDTTEIKPLDVFPLGRNVLIYKCLTSEEIARLASIDLPVLCAYLVLDSLGNVKEVSFEMYKKDPFWPFFPPDRFYEIEQVIMKYFVFPNAPCKRLVSCINCHSFKDVESKMMELDSIAAILLPKTRAKDSAWASLLKKKIESGNFEIDIPGSGIVVCRCPQTAADSLVSGKTEPGFLCVAGDSIHSCLDRDFFNMKYGLGDLIPPFEDGIPRFTYPIMNYRMVENDSGGYNVSYESIKPQPVIEGQFYEERYWLRVYPDGRVYVKGEYGGPYVGIIRE